jgi:hypothetical protein
MELYVIRCPEQSEWNIRAEIHCKNITKYFVYTITYIIPMRKVVLDQSGTYGPGRHVEYPTGTKNSNFVEDHPRNIPVKFGCNWPSGF